MAVISIQGLCKTFGAGTDGEVKAVNELTLNVPEGRIFGFLGPNGAGKTTTIKLLLGLIKADAGAATILGEPMGSLSAKRRLGFLSESPYFYNYLTGAEFLEFYGRLFEMRPLQLEQKIDDLLTAVGLKGKANVRLSKYSRGMLQRIGIAQAIINDPDVVILDEPITGLDPQGRKEVRDIILNLKKKGTSIFFSSHVLHDVQEMCDDIAIINKGRLVCVGPIDELLGVKEYGVSADGLPNAVRDRLEGMGAAVSKKDARITAVTGDKAKFAEITRIMETSGKNIEITKTLANLEDFFLQQVGSSGKEE
ncbi:MAG: ABC transporter ATP-binding protein [Planctomycetota bacterium]